MATCYVSTGGTWYYTDHKRPNQGAAAYKELVSNDGKELMAFTDFPMPKKNEMVQDTHFYTNLFNSHRKWFCDFILLMNINLFFKNMPWQQYLKYLQDYAQHFDLKRCIQFNTRVTKVTPAADYSDTGRCVTITNTSKKYSGFFPKSESVEVVSKKSFSGKSTEKITKNRLITSIMIFQHCTSS